MKDKLWYLLFGESSLLKQSYFWFVFSVVILIGIILPQWLLVKLVYVLSCLALTIGAQGFIASAQGNQKLVSVGERLEDVGEDVVDKIAEDDRIPTKSL